jgi:excisionase family DNA binding protein
MTTLRERLARAETTDVLMHKSELTVEEVAELLGFSADMIRRAIRDGELHARIVGHQVCGIGRADLIAWLERLGA